MKRLRYDSHAESELAEAAEYYATENATAALRFVGRVTATVTEIRQAPHVWPLEPSVPKSLDVRRRVVVGFPYAVVYKDFPTEVVILAIAHRREPGYWRTRLPAR